MMPGPEIQADAIAQRSRLPAALGAVVAERRC